MTKPRDDLPGGLESLRAQCLKGGGVILTRTQSLDLLAVIDWYRRGMREQELLWKIDDQAAGIKARDRLIADYRAKLDHE